MIQCVVTSVLGNFSEQWSAYSQFVCLHLHVCQMHAFSKQAPYQRPYHAHRTAGENCCRSQLPKTKVDTRITPPVITKNRQKQETEYQKAVLQIRDAVETAHLIGDFCVDISLPTVQYKLRY